MFQFNQRSAIRLKLRFNRHPCEGTDTFRWDRDLWVHLVILALASLHLALTMKYLVDIRQRYIRLK